MATNWLPPAGSYPEWIDLQFSDVQTGIRLLTELGFVKDQPTAQERNLYFKQVKCDEDHPCNGIMVVAPTGERYPFAYCTGATHKSLLVLWVVGYDSNNQPCYDLGWDSGNGAE